VTQMSNQLQTISRFLWVDTQAEEAVKFYTSIFTGAALQIHRSCFVCCEL